MQAEPFNRSFMSCFENLAMKARLSAMFFIWKLVFIHVQTKLISIREALHLTSISEWGSKQLGITFSIGGIDFIINIVRNGLKNKQRQPQQFSSILKKGCNYPKHLSFFNHYWHFSIVIIISILPVIKDLETGRLATIFIRITTHFEFTRHVLVVQNLLQIYSTFNWRWSLHDRNMSCKLKCVVILIKIVSSYTINLLQVSCIIVYFNIKHTCFAITELIDRTECTRCASCAIKMHSWIAGWAVLFCTWCRQLFGTSYIFSAYLWLYPHVFHLGLKEQK